MRAIRQIASCNVTVACQYCQPLKRPLGIAVPLVGCPMKPPFWKAGATIGVE